MSELKEADLTNTTSFIPAIIIVIIIIIIGERRERGARKRRTGALIGLAA